MKTKPQKFVILLVLVMLVITTSVLLDKQNQQKENHDFIRIHIRANSNSDFDQQIKHQVKEVIITYLTPLLANANTKDEALLAIISNAEGIQEQANITLKACNVAYTSEAMVRKEEFPTRKYGDFVLEKGVYDALIINLGKGQGDNWWCVAFPPLCFVPEKGQNVRYKSKILEIINKAKA